jgi:hypothetical protein
MYRLIVLLLLISAFGCDGYTALRGHVVDGAGKPVPGAKVTLMQGDFRVGIEVQSKEDGSFDVAGTHAPSHDALDFRVHKDGFYDDVRRVPPESNDHMRIIMEREKPADAKADNR